MKHDFGYELVDAETYNNSVGDIFPFGNKEHILLGAVTASTLAPEYGSDVVLTITPSQYFLLKSLTVNDEDVTAQVADAQYTIVSVKADINVVAEFEQDPKVVGINAAKMKWEPGTVYDLRDRKVADGFKLNRLPAGVYIVDGKIVVAN